MVASVIVTVSNSNVDQTFDYSVPTSMQNIIKIGSRVTVPFGQADRTIMGYVIDLKEETNYVGNMKSINELLDIEPLISKEQFELAKWIQYDSLSPMVRILNMMIPKALRLKTVKYLNIKNYSLLDADLAMALGGKSFVEYTKNLYQYEYKIQKEREKGNIEITYDALTTTKEKVINKYIIDMDAYFLGGYKVSDYVKDVLRSLVDDVPMTINEISDTYEISTYMVNSLIKKGLLKKVSEKVSRVSEKKIATSSKYRSSDFDKISETYQKLSTDESLPRLWIPKNIEETELFLLKVVNENSSKNKRTLVITADILSSYKYASLIRKETKKSVLCINSSLSDGEYLDAYYDIKDNKHDVYVSTSVGALLPYQNIETIILMNSENDNYFNDQSPRFDLKKVMIERGNIEGAKGMMYFLLIILLLNQ